MSLIIGNHREVVPTVGSTRSSVCVRRDIFVGGNMHESQLSGSFSSGPKCCLCGKHIAEQQEEFQVNIDPVLMMLVPYKGKKLKSRN